MKLLIYIIILLLAIPNGLILARLCKEELKGWRYRFKIFTVISILVAIVSYLSNISYKIPISLSLLYLAITFLTLVKKAK